MNPTHFSSHGSRTIISRCAALLALGVISVVSQSPAQVINLTQPNSSAQINLSGPGAGMNQWSVSGQNQLNLQWFYYGLLSGPQLSIDNIGAPVFSQPNAYTLNASYGNGSFSVDITYVLQDGGSGQSDINESISIHNLTGSLLNIHFFQYSDFNLGGVPGGDTLVMDNQNAFQQKGLTAIAEGIIDPNAGHFEANTTGGPTSTLAKLGSTPGLILSDNALAAGDVTWAYQWDFQIAGFGSQEILKDKLLQITLIPEPSMLALLAAGVGLWSLRKRRA
jgi:hypothetical protein